MVFIKDVAANLDAGTATKWGGNDINYLDDYFDNVDITPKVAKINTRTYFRSGKFEWRNPADSFSYIVSTGAITGNRTVSLPVLSADDTFAFIGITNTFSIAQVISLASSGTNLELLTTSNSVGTHPDLLWRMKDSANNTTTYALAKGQIVTNTDGSEDGKFVIQLMNAGTLSDRAVLNQDGSLEILTNLTNATAFWLKRGRNNANDTIDINFQHFNSSSSYVTYEQIRDKLITNTAGSEDGELTMFIRRAGSMPTASPTFVFNRNGYFTMFHNASTNADEWGLSFYALDSGSALQEYGDLSMEITDGTAGSEDAQFDWDLVRGGSVVRVMKLDNTGKLTIGRDTSNQRGVPSCVNTNSDDVRFVNSAVENTMSSRTVKGAIVGADGQVEVKFFGYILQNSATATTYTLRVKVGGTTIWAGAITPAIAQDVDKRPFYMEFNFFPSNQSSTTARMNGFVSINDGGTPTTGQGNIADDEIDSNGPIRAEGISWTFANDTTVAFTIQMDQAQAATEWQMDAERWTLYPS